MNTETVFFFCVAALAVGSALLMITRLNPVKSVLFLIVNFVVVRQGVFGLPDSFRYITGAENLLAGEPMVYKGFSYIGYIAIIAALL